MEKSHTSKYKILNRDVIKYVAMFTMVLNHTAVIFLEQDTLLCEILIAIGYFTAVTMVYFLVEGYHYTHSKKDYTLRLLLFAVISQIPYGIAFTQQGIMEFNGFNMLFTLSLCLGIIWVTENIKNKGLKVFLILVGISVSMFCDWALLAPVFTLLFVWAKDCEKRKKPAFCLSALAFGADNFILGIGSLSIDTNIFRTCLGMAGMALAALCIMFFYNGERMRGAQTFSKWFFYVFYPAHLLVLGIVRVFLT